MDIPSTQAASSLSLYAPFASRLSCLCPTCTHSSPPMHGRRSGFSVLPLPPIKVGPQTSSPLRLTCFRPPALARWLDLAELLEQQAERSLPGSSRITSRF